MGKKNERKTTESRIRPMSIESVSSVLKGLVNQNVYLKIVYLRGGAKFEQIIPPTYVEFTPNRGEVKEIRGFQHDLPLDKIISITKAS